MKKLFLPITLLLLALTLVACNPKADPAQEKLDNAYNALEMVIKEPNAITTAFNVPTALADGVKAEWSSSETGIVSVGTESGGFVQIVVNRPSKGSGNASVTLTAKLTIKAENSDKTLEKVWNKDLTVLEQAVADLNIENIADILEIRDDAYDPSEKADKVSVTIKDATVIGEGSDAVFVYDGTGVIQVYGGANKDMKVGKVYTISGLLEWYFGIWEIIDSTAVVQEGATPQFPEKEEEASVDALIAGFVEDEAHVSASGSAKDGNFEPVYASVTGKIHLIAGDTSNYNTYIVDTGYDTTKPWVGGSDGNPAKGLLVYYNTNNFNDLRAYDGFEVTIDVLIYTYRSNNQAFAVYYIGGKDGIVLGELTDEQKVELDLATLKLPLEVFETKEKALDLITEGPNGSTISWTKKSGAEGLIDLETGDVTIPATGVEKVVLTATSNSGNETDTRDLEVYIGAVQEMTIAEAKQLGKGRTFIITGVVTAEVANQTFSLQDDTGAISLRGTADTIRAWIGKEVKVKGNKDLYNGLHQSSNTALLTEGELAAGTMPEAVVLDTLDLTKLEAHQSKLVNLNNVLITKYAKDDYDNVTMTLTRADGQTISFKWDSRVNVTDDDSDNPLLALKEGDLVNLVAAPLGWNNGALVGFDKVTQVVKVETPTDQVKLEFDLLGYKPELNYAKTGDLNLPGEGIYFDSVVTYDFKNIDDANNALVDLEEGKVVSIPENGAEVHLIVTIVQGDLTENIEITLSLTTDVELEKMTFGVYGGSGTGYSAGELTWTETSGSFTVNKDRVQINKSTFEPHDGEAMLVFAPVSATTTAFVEFDFSDDKYKDMTKIEFGLSAWNNSKIGDITKLENARFVVEYKDGDSWVTIETVVLKDTLVANTYAKVRVNTTHGNGTYRISYIAEDAASGNTTQAVGLDNLRIIK